MLAHISLYAAITSSSAKQVQLKLGHHSPAFTLATYVHLLPDDLADADYMDEVLPVPGIDPVPSGAVASRRPGKSEEGGSVRSGLRVRVTSTSC